MEILLQVLSLVGAGAILGAYLAPQRGWWHRNGSAYLWCNLVGALVLSVVALADQRVGFVLLESAWAGVSLVSLIRGPTHDGPVSAP